MNAAELDNPVWSSLCTTHQHVARRVGAVARYPRDFAPFMGVASADEDTHDALATLVAPHETVLTLGVIPRSPPGWTCERQETIAQLVCVNPAKAEKGPEIVPLDPSHRADVLALIALVYPHYFRPRTMELGRYFGIYVPETSSKKRLAAMIGERFSTGACTEMSTICTHPDFTGRGYAHRLTAFLTSDRLAYGRTPFLHVSYDNPRAKALYEDLGYRLRRDLVLCSFMRT